MQKKNDANLSVQYFKAYLRRNYSKPVYLKYNLLNITMKNNYG